MSQDTKLSDYLDKVRAVYDVDCIIRHSPGTEEIAEYYTQSQLGYSVLHSLRGAVHMAISPDGKFNHKDYEAQAEFVHQYLYGKDLDNVLEIASGKGFNTIYLAQRHPDVQFTGFDLTPVHVKIAAHRASKLKNVKFEQGDFHELRYADEQFDYAFAVESICHSLDLHGTLEGIHRILKPGSDLILFDSFKLRHSDLTPDENLATQLIEKSMALNSFPTYDDLMSVAEAVGFEVVEVEDLSHAVMPNLVRFEYMARIFFAIPLFGKLLKSTLPQQFTQNAIAGLLMPLASELRILPYYRIVLRRR